MKQDQRRFKLHWQMKCQSTPADPFSIPKQSGEQTNPVALETGDTSSSTESCKTPVAPGNDVTITVEDDDGSKSPSLISENESSFAQVIYARKESATETTLKMAMKNEMSNEVNNNSDNQGTQCDKDDMGLKVPADEGKPFVTSYFAIPLSLCCFFLQHTQLEHNGIVHVLLQCLINLNKSTPVVDSSAYY